MQHIADELTVPNLFTIGNVSGNPRATMYDEKLESNSVFGQASIGWKRTVYLDLTARNDWSSTLPADSWSYFYPSATFSLILSELLQSANSRPDFLSFAKIRGGWAQVGNDTAPYALNATYSANTPFNGISQFFTNRTLPPVGLMPEKTTSFEFGIEFMLFQDRIGFDITYYDMITTNQILAVQVSNATGYNSMLINAGEIEIGRAHV